MKTFRGLVRYYTVDKSVDKFINTNINVSDRMIQELLAYYRGEPVTSWIVNTARKCYCGRKSPLPKLIFGLGTITFECSDTTLKTDYDVSTVCRHYEYLSDLYEFDPTIRVFTLPFSSETVERAVTIRDDSDARHMYDMTDELLACIKFLRPKMTETYLYYNWHSMDEEFARHIGRDLTRETKLSLGQFASVLPDEELYPIITWAAQLGQRDVLFSLLEEKAPSVLFWCLLNGESYREDTYVRDIMYMVETYSFDDKVVVLEPHSMDWNVEYDPTLVEDSEDTRGENTPSERLKLACCLAVDNSSTVEELERTLVFFGYDSSKGYKAPFNIVKRVYKPLPRVLIVRLEALRDLEGTQ